MRSRPTPGKVSKEGGGSRAPRAKNHLVAVQEKGEGGSLSPEASPTGKVSASRPYNFIVHNSLAEGKGFQALVQILYQPCGHDQKMKLECSCPQVWYKICTRAWSSF